MRTDIQFEKIGVQKPSKFKQARMYVLTFLLLAFISFISVLSVRAYFTAKATNSGELTFGLIEVNLLDSTGASFANSGDESFQTKYVTGILPGSVISINDAQIKNTGTHEEYVLLNFDVNIAEGTTKELHYNVWYNIAGEEVNINNFAINSAKASLIQPNAYETTNIVWKVPGDAVDNNYKGATAKVTLTAYGTQTNIPDSDKYLDKDLYASYFICKNVADISADTNTTYLGSQVYGEPLKKVIASRNLFNLNRVETASNTFNYSIENNVVTREASKGVATSWLIQAKDTSGKETLYNKILDTKYLEAGVYTWSLFYHEGNQVKTSGNYITLTLLDSNTTLAWNEGEAIVLTEKAFIKEIRSVEKYFLEGQKQVFSIQIEKGTTVTDYDAYNAFEDTFDINTQTVTRNVGKTVLTGDETFETPTATEYSLLKNTYFPNIDTTYGTKQMYCSHFPLSEIEAATTLLTFRAGTSYINFNYDNGVGGVDIFKTYLKEQYNNGTPVTIWYKLATPTTEKVYTSKNLYNGEQFLYYKTGDAASTTESTGKYTISNANLVNYLKDKNFVVSANIKKYSDDTSKVTELGDLGYMFSMTYINNVDGDKTIYSTAIISSETYEEEFVYNWISNQQILDYYTSDQLKNITQIDICFSLFNHSDNYFHFDVKNIQIEIGEAPTDFE